MTDFPAADEVAHFRSLIVQRLGLYFDESKLGNLAKILHQRALARNQTCEHYLSQMAGAHHSADELYQLAGELTVTETYFLRNSDQFRAYAEVALPDRLAAKAGGDTVRILSAGCASGDEPYSLAIVAHENFAHALRQIAITAIDVNTAMLAKATRARYTHWSLRDFPPSMKTRWFKADADGFNLDPAIRTMVRFEQRNLAHAAGDFWQPGSLDIVFCRNVLMYFSPEQAQAAIARIARALVPGGYFFLGHAETLRGLSNDFLLCHTHGTFYYQRKQGDVTPAEVELSQSPRWQPAAALGDTSWIDAIQRASDRIHALSLPSVMASPAPAGDATAQSGPNLHRALEFLHVEQYDQTLAQIGALPVAHAMDPDVLLLKAVSLSHSGALDAAKATCQALLQRDALNAGAYYVLALCCEGVSDLVGAIEHNQTAVYLDPGFAMPRLHLGLLARRQGDTTAALHDLNQALQLLQQEDASRLLLFAGGFRREALIALCRAELTSLGAVP